MTEESARVFTDTNHLKPQCLMIPLNPNVLVSFGAQGDLFIGGLFGDAGLYQTISCRAEVPMYSPKSP